MTTTLASPFWVIVMGRPFSVASLLGHFADEVGGAVLELCDGPDVSPLRHGALLAQDIIQYGIMSYRWIRRNTGRPASVAVIGTAGP
jgi:hypothetical protein